MVKKTLHTAADIIEALGGSLQLAQLTGATRNSVSNWKAFNAFPARYYLLMTSALEKRGFKALPEFWSQQSKRERAA